MPVRPPGGRYLCSSSGLAALSYTSSQLIGLRLQCFKHGRDRPVATAVRGRLPELQPLGQLDQARP